MRKEELLEKVDLYLEGELSEKEMTEFEKLLNSCPECREEVEKYRKLLMITRVIARKKPLPPPDLKTKILNQIEAELSSNGRFIFLKLAALTLSLVIVVFGITYIPAILNQGGERRVTTTLTDAGSSHSSGKRTVQNPLTAENVMQVSPEILKLANDQFVSYTSEVQKRLNQTSSYTYIVPITSSESWKKVAKFLRLYRNGYRVAVKPIIRDRRSNYRDVIATLNRVKEENPGVTVEDVSFNPSYSAGNYNAGVILQISVQR